MFLLQIHQKFDLQLFKMDTVFVSILDNSQWKWMKWMKKTLAVPKTALREYFGRSKTAHGEHFTILKIAHREYFFKFILVIHGFIVFLQHIKNC